MLADVLVALQATNSIESVIVVTAEPGVQALSDSPKELLVGDGFEEGQSKAAAVGLEKAAELGFRQALLVPGDCPLVDPAELDRLIEQADARDLGAVIVPDRHKEGTNAVLLKLPSGFEPQFGPGSLERHEKQAERRGLRYLVEPVESLALDVDTPEDLAALLTALDRNPVGAARARAVIRETLRASGGRPIPAG
jgi:2-phospho-L-lactate guanylyltransferase